MEFKVIMTKSTIFFEMPGIVYNSEEPSYDIHPFHDSIIIKGKIFASKKTHGFGDFGIVGIALELSEPLDEKNSYKTIERLKNLICLAFGSKPQEISWADEKGIIEEIVERNLAEKFYDKDIRINGQLDWESPRRVMAYSNLVDLLHVGQRKKFWQALQTFAYAREIAHLPNPQYRYTLYMTLHLASIDQLAPNPKNLHDKKTKLLCPICGETSISHTTSHRDEIVKMMDEMIDLHKDKWVDLAKRLYHPVRSNFVHDGDLAGSEDIGGFIALWKDGAALVEDNHNLMILNKMLLEKFLQRAQEP
jgi:hypothetical protein